MTTRQAKAKLRRKYGWHFHFKQSKYGDLYAYKEEIDDEKRCWFYFVEAEHYPYKDGLNVRIGCESSQTIAPIVILTFEEYELFSILIDEVKKNRDKLLARWKEKEKNNE